MAGVSRHASRGIVAKLQFLSSRESDAAYVASVAGEAAATHDGQYTFHELFLADGRAHAAGFSIDREGFQLMKQPSPIEDFFDEEKLTEIYEAEVTKLVQAHTGCRRVKIFDHTRRSASDALRRQLKTREPSSVVHNDYSEWSATNRLKAVLPEEAEELMKGRFAIVNVWRSISGSVENNPLAFCDSTSLDVTADLVPVKRKAADRVGEVQLGLYNPAQKWFYFPRMSMDEALLFKTFDSHTQASNRFTLHAAFEDPSSDPDAPPRQSIETRCFIFF